MEAKTTRDNLFTYYMMERLGDIHQQSYTHMSIII